MPKKRVVLFCIMGLIVLIWLTIPAALQQTPTRTPTRTPRPTPTPRSQTLRKSVLSNSVRGLGLNAPFDAHLPPCQSAGSGVSFWHHLQPVGTTAEVTTLSRDNGVMLRVTDNFFPAICSSDPITFATATHLETGENFNALVWDYDPLQVQSNNSVYEGSVPRYYVAQLPIDAYTRPGNWRLRTPALEITITVAAPQNPAGLMDGTGTYLLMGFQPDERVIGLIFSGFPSEVKDDFEVVTNAQGMGRYTSSIVYWTVDSSATTEGLMLMVGDGGSGLYYPLGEFGTSIFLADVESSPADLNADGSIPVQELMEYVRRSYWIPVPAADCAGALPGRLVIGARARVTPGDANNLRASASQGAARVGSIPGGAEFTVLSGPVCNGGYLWWQVNYNGTTGWTAESGAGDYWLEPLTGASIATAAPLAAQFSRNLFLTTPRLTGEDVSAVQSRLIDLGYDPGPVDGIYGPVTEAAVILYQLDNGLTPDGIVGPITWGSLFP